MIRIDEHLVPASPRACFQVAADVERWPEILPHYRWVKFRRKEDFGRGLVEMAAWRAFGPLLRFPTWWVSEMTADPNVPIIRYRHVEGITRGMEVRWEFLDEGERTRVRIVHEWSGPAWPVIGRLAASGVIGPGFVSVIARRTLAGVGGEAAHGEDRQGHLRRADHDRADARNSEHDGERNRRRRGESQTRQGGHA